LVSSRRGTCHMSCDITIPTCVIAGHTVGSLRDATLHVPAADQSGGLLYGHHQHGLPKRNPRGQQPR
jgi:hypothetical protein